MGTQPVLVAGGNPPATMAAADIIFSADFNFRAALSYSFFQTF